MSLRGRDVRRGRRDRAVAFRRIERLHGITLAATLLASSAGAAIAAPSGEAPARSFLILTLGQTLSGFRVPADLVRTLERDPGVVPDSLPLVYPLAASAAGETLSLGEPVFSCPLPGLGTDVLLPETPGGPLYVTTRRGLVRFDPSRSPAAPEIFLGGWDLNSLARLEDGTLLLLERAFADDFRAALPAHLFAFRPGESNLPDTALVCTAGAMRLHVLDGDSVIWVPRIHGRALDRVARRHGRWEKSEIVVAPPVWTEEQFGLLPTFVSEGRNLLVVERGRGQRPKLLELDVWGHARELFRWSRGLSPFSGAFAPGARLLLLNGMTNYSAIDLERRSEYSWTVLLLHTSVTISTDGWWVVTSGVDREGQKTEIQLRRRGSPRAAEAWLDEAVALVRLIEEPS